jgi:Arylsulfotransferase (ASST)
MNPRLLVPTLTSLLFALSCSGGSEHAAMASPASRDGFDSNAAWPGFTLVSPLQSKTVYLADMSGNAVHTWASQYKTGEMAYLTDRGTLLKSQRAVDHPTFQDAGGHGGRIQEIDWNGDVLWDFQWDSESGLNHHDIEELPNGNVLFIAWDRTTREVALAAGRDPELLEGEEFWAGAVYEVEPTRPVGGKIVWSWHALDHVIQNHDESLTGYAKPWEHPEKIDINGDRNPDPPDEEEQKKIDEEIAAIGYAGGDDGAEEAEDEETHADEEEEEEDPEDLARKARTKGADWMHTNGVDYNAELDQIVISVRRYDEIWIIDHATTTEEARGPQGDLLYRWGNPYSYGMGAWEDRQLFGQHNAQWIPEGHLGAGNLLVFNNGSKPREWSTVDEWWAPRDAQGRYPREEGQPWGPTAPVWSYTAEEPEDFFSRFVSGIERLPNGNTLVCAGAQSWVFEVTPSGEVVWDWKSPFGPQPGEEEDGMENFSNAMFRAPRYAADHPGIVALRAKGAPIPLDPGSGPATNQWIEPEEEEDEDE